MCGMHGTHLHGREWWLRQVSPGLTAARRYDMARQLVVATTALVLLFFGPDIIMRRRRGHSATHADRHVGHRPLVARPTAVPELCSTDMSKHICARCNGAGICATDMCAGGVRRTSPVLCIFSSATRRRTYASSRHKHMRARAHARTRLARQTTVCHAVCNGTYAHIWMYEHVHASTHVCICTRTLMHSHTLPRPHSCTSARRRIDQIRILYNNDYITVIDVLW